MALTINTNVSALSAQRNLSASATRSASSLAKLSSGSRITSAKDDAASLAIASGLGLDLASLKAAQSNISQATSMLQIADAGYSQIGDILGRMQTLASTARSDQISNTERGFLNTEYGSLLSEIDRIANATEYNGVELLSGTTGVGSTVEANAIGTGVEIADGFSAFTFDANLRANGEAITIEFDKDSNVFTVTALDGSGGNPLASQTLDLDDLGDTPSAGSELVMNFDEIGVAITINSGFDNSVDIAANNEVTIQTAAAGVNGTQLTFKVGVDAADTITANVRAATQSDLGVNGGSISTSAGAAAALTAIDTAMQRLNTDRSEVGALLSRLEFAGANVASQAENVTAAKSTLMDVDVASEMTNFTSQQVLVQAGVSMLAQANQQPSMLMRLLQ